MTQHYYSAKPETGSRPQQMEVTLRGKTFILTTDTGIFSKKGIDFGSMLLIQTMEIEQDARVLDVGCGYGPIGLAASVVADRGQVTMIDINERAVELARKNAERNGANHVRVLQSDTLEKVMGETFDCVLTNPPIRAGKEVVHRIFDQAYDVLRKGGRLWVVIQKKQGAPSAFAKLEERFAFVEEVTRDKGYWILKATKVNGM